MSCKRQGRRPLNKDSSKPGPWDPYYRKPTSILKAVPIVALRGSGAERKMIAGKLGPVLNELISETTCIHIYIIYIHTYVYMYMYRYMTIQIW